MTRSFLFVSLFLMACGADDAPTESPAAEPATPVVEPAPAPAQATAKTEEKPPADGPADIDGKAIYNQYCVACHGADGKGNNGLAANYVDDETRLAQSDEVLIQSIKEGKQGDVGVMPPWGGTLDDGQIKAVLGYIRAEFGVATAVE